MIYLGGPIDLASGDADGRRAFKEAVANGGAAVYDATTAFTANPQKWLMRQVHDVIRGHHAMLECCSIAVFDLSAQSVGTPIEMQSARSLPIRGPEGYLNNGNVPGGRRIYAYMDPVKPSLYVEGLANGVSDSWDQIANWVLARVDQEASLHALQVHR